MLAKGKVESPPYVSFKTFLNFLEWLHDEGTPSRLDRSFWGERLSGAYGFQLMGALRFLRLVDSNHKPDPDLEQMAQDLEARKRLVAERLQSCYGALKGLDIERASLGELQERFRNYRIEGETLRKALAFYIHASEFCGMQLSPHITRGPRNVKKAEALRRKGKPLRKQPAVVDGPPREPAAARNPLPDDLHPCLHGLLVDLLAYGRDWTMESRQRWVNTFLSNIDYVYPVRET